uniref:RRM domain-containing protein n=2 Tax=Auxenochlorella protothecoides TaxID=3075 RepID=A0A1D2ACV6_AUXPR
MPLPAPTPAISFDHRISTGNSVGLLSAGQLSTLSESSAESLGEGLQGVLEGEALVSSADVDARKVVVLGVPWQTEDSALTRHFSQYGAVEDAQIMRERYSGKSRGFGFVTFASPSDARTAVASEHVIDGRKCEAKFALPEGKVGSARTTRIFVARIPFSVSDTSFRAYFEQFGAVQDAYMPKDPSKAGHRGIGFVTYAGAEAVDRVMARSHVLGGNEVAIDRATPKDRGAGASAAAAAAMLPGRLSMSQPNLPLLGGGGAGASAHGSTAVAEYLRALAAQGPGAAGAGSPRRDVRPVGRGNVPSQDAYAARRNASHPALSGAVPAGSAGVTPDHTPRGRGSEGYLDAGGAASAGGGLPEYLGALHGGGGGASGGGGLHRALAREGSMGGSAGGGLHAMLAQAAYQARLAGSASFGSLEGGAGAGPGGGLLRVPSGQALGAQYHQAGPGDAGARYHHQAGAGGDAFGSYGHGLDALGGGAYAPGYSQDLARTASDALASSWMGGGGGSLHGGGSLQYGSGLLHGGGGGSMHGGAGGSLHGGGSVHGGTSVHAGGSMHGGSSMQHGGGGSMHGPASARAGPRIFVGKLNKDTSEADVKDYFGTFGFVMDVYLPRDRANKREHRGFGFVTFETEASIQRVVAHGAHQIRGAFVAIDAAVPRQEEILSPGARPAGSLSHAASSGAFGSPSPANDGLTAALESMRLGTSGGSGLWGR